MRRPRDGSIEIDLPPIASTLTPLELAQQLETFFAEHPRAVVMEDGKELFDMRLARYSLTSEHNRCMLHLWSEDRNMVRTVTGLRQRTRSLQLETRRFGQIKPQMLQVLPDQDRRTPTARDTSRRQFLHRMQSLVEQHLDGRLENFSTAMDLEQSLGPAYARGLLTRGPSAWAVVGVNPQEDAGTVQNAISIGILWLHACRQRLEGRRVVEGLHLLLPRGTTQPVRERMAWLDPSLAKWRLWEYDTEGTQLTQVDTADNGNLSFRLIHSFNADAVIERSNETLTRVLTLLPADLRSRTEVRPRSTNEIGLLLHGLEYARIRREPQPGSFALADRVTFGAGPGETELNEETQPWLLDLASRLAQSRIPRGSQRDPLYRMQPELWMESQLRRNLEMLDPTLRGEFLYAQVPAFSAADRGMLDLLLVTQQGRLAIVELKAEEDMHLPMQTLDYWMRVRALLRSGELQRFGYFPGVELSAADPLLYMVAPALRLHPTYPTLLQYFAPEVEWQVVGLDEHWREEPRVILRRRRLS
jgi:hypothetical protein